MKLPDSAHVKDCWANIRRSFLSTRRTLHGRLSVCSIRFFTHASLPVAAAYCRTLDVMGVVNRIVPTEMRLSPGLAVQAMVLDVLSCKNPLYRIEQFWEQ
ncbi:MAG: DUF4277 domain-containing protein [Sphaerochaeta sp.]